MSSSGRFQSRVLSFLSQQSLRWRDRLEKTLRQTQVAALWGVQILLYPAYVTFQSGRVAGRSLGAANRQAKTRLRQLRQAIQTIFQPLKPSTPAIAPPKADTPLIHTLAAVKALALPLVVNPNYHPPASPPIAEPSAASLESVPSPWDGDDEMMNVEQEAIATTLATDPEIIGLATLLETQALVLVASGNQVLDWLTPHQQHYLQRCVARELATYYRQQKQGLPEPELPFLPPPLPRQNLLPPVKVFRQAMAWMQRSPVAIAANLFQEASFSDYLQKRQHPPTKGGKLANRVNYPAIQENLQAPVPLPELTAASIQPEALESAIRQEVKRSSAIHSSANRSSDGSLANRQIDQRSLTKPSFTNSQPVKQPLGRSQQESGVLTVSAQSSEKAIAPQSDDTPGTPVSSPDYIETQATLVSYVYHPLERLLKGIDSLMLWLEKAIARFWERLFKS